jgi:hypothetical protein
LDRPDLTIHVSCWAVNDARTIVRGTDSTIFWNPNWTGGNLGGLPAVQQDPTATLIHEFSHAAQAALGVFPDNTTPANRFAPAPMSEQRCGVYIENMYRRANNLRMREVYKGTHPINRDAFLPCCEIGQVECNDKCCSGNASCSTAGTCVCPGGTQACVTACCAPSDSCTPYTDAVLPPAINAAGFCCSPGHFGCVFRPGGANSGNLLSTVCCSTSTQSCQGDPPPGQPGGCVSR